LYFLSVFPLFPLSLLYSFLLPFHPSLLCLFLYILGYISHFLHLTFFFLYLYFVFSGFICFIVYFIHTSILSLSVPLIYFPYKFRYLCFLSFLICILLSFFSFITSSLSYSSYLLYVPSFHPSASFLMSNPRSLSQSCHYLTSPIFVTGSHTRGAGQMDPDRRRDMGQSDSPGEKPESR
jgi:hypothetical protein